MLDRSLTGMHALIARSLAEVRITHGIQSRRRFLVSGFIDELAPAAALEANARGLTLTVLPIDGRVAITADRQVLAAVGDEICCRTRSSSRGPRPPSSSGSAPAPSACSSRSRTNAAACPVGTSTNCSGRSSSGAPTARAWVLASRSADGGFEANDGRIDARSLPEVGCVFTIDLPRVQVTTPAYRAGFAISTPAVRCGRQFDGRSAHGPEFSPAAAAPPAFRYASPAR